MENKKAPQRAGKPTFMGIEDQIDPYRVLVSIQRPVIKAEMTGRCSRSSLAFPLLVWFPLLVQTAARSSRLMQRGRGKWWILPWGLLH